MKLVLINCFCSTNFILAVNTHLQTAQQTPLFPEFVYWFGQIPFIYYFCLPKVFKQNEGHNQDTSEHSHKPSRQQQPGSASTAIYRVIQEESARLREMIVCVILSKKVHINMCPILDGYGVMTIFLIPVHALVWTTSHSWRGHILR